MSVDNKAGGENTLNYFSNSTKSFLIQNKPALPGIVTFTILAFLIGVLSYQRFLISREVIQKESKDFVVAAKDRLQESLAQAISATKTLSFFIQADGSVKDFDSVAAQILAGNTNIDVLQLVPDGIIRYVYPLQGNENVVGYNILQDPGRNAEAVKAIQQKKLFFAGPLALKQGGMGVVGRLPVYRNGKFWGFSAVVIRLSTLLKAAGIDSLAKNGYYFQLSKINPATHKEEFFISHPKDVAGDNFVSVNIPNGDWKLSATPVNMNKGYTDIFGFALLGFLFAALGGIFVYTVARRPESLERLITLRTAALKESEEKYRSLVEQAPDAVIVYSYDGVIHQFNKAAYIQTGYTESEYAKLKLWDLLVEKKVNIDQQRVEELKSGKNAIFQKQCYKKDGSIIDVEINASLLPDGKLLAYIRNVTERGKAEAALKESEEKFSKAFQSNLLAFAINDEQGKVIDLNERFAALLETTRDKMVGKNSDDTKLLNKVVLQKRNEVREYVKNILTEKGNLKNFEIQIETNGKRVLYLLLSVEALELNKQKNWLTTVIDITEKKVAELSLVQSEIKYRSLIEHASDGIIISDLRGIIMEVNQSICKMGGYTIEEMTGRHINNFMPKSDITEQPLRIQDLVQGKALQYERRMLRKDGTTIEVEINSRMAGANILVGFVRDITERKKSAEELIKSNERFELVANATNDAIWDHDFIKNETTGNDKLYNLYGFVPGKDTINFELFESRVHPGELARLQENLKKAISEKAVSVKEEFRFKMPDGTYKHLYDRAYIKYDESGMPLRMLGAMQDVSEGIQDKQRIMKEKELSDSIINNLPAVFYLHNKQGEFLRWNKKFEMVTGYTGEEISGLHTLDIFGQEERRLLEEKIKSVFMAGQDTVEANLLLKNGQKIPYYFSGIRIDYEGEICLMGFGLDFSDRMQSERLLKESEQKFRSLVEQASDGIVILSQQGNALYISPSVERILGYSEFEMMQLNIFEMTQPDDIIQVQKIIDEVNGNPGCPIKGFISRILHKDGNIRWLETTVTSMLHIPAINGVVLNFRDITEKLMIEKKSIAEKELSDSIINSLPGIFFLYDHTGKFIRWNKNLEIISGYGAEEIREMRPLDFYHADEKRQVKKRIESIFLNQAPAEELLISMKNGKKISFLINSLAIEYEGVACIVGMGFDVTDRKKIEKELLVSNKELKQKAEELENSYSELERFAYIVSHDLQEPLRMVSSFLKLLQQKYKAQLDATADKYIYFAVDGAERMKQLITDLLEYSRTGTNKDIAVDTDMNEVMTEVMKVLENSIQEQNAVVETGLLPVLAKTSKIQMFQLLQNLLSNALKYHSEKPLQIKMEVKEVNDQWIFSIRDNGIGIDPKYAEKIFEIFQRLHSKTEFSGTGIGLSICKKIVEKNGGRIWVESTEGNGAIFYFSIPKK